MADRKPMHLKDLFKTGKEVTLQFELEGEEYEIRMWMRKPTTSQQDEALSKARGKQARRKKLYKDESSDQYLATWAEAENFETREELIEQLSQYEVQRLQTQAFNDVLYNDEFVPKDEEGEPKWGKDNAEYLEVVSAIYERMTEIDKFNDDLDEEDSELQIKYDEDEELVALQADRDEFEKHVEARYETLIAAHKKTEYKGKTSAELRKLLVKKVIDTETSMAWYEEYRTRMLYHSCREIEDKSKPYFDSPEDLLQLPPSILTYLEDQMDQLLQGGQDLKNLHSLQPSSSS